MKKEQSPLDRVYTEEATLLRKVTEYLAPQLRDGIKVLRICDRYHKGYSDLFICVQGFLVVAELKDDTGKPTVHQELFIEEMQQCGAVGGICRTVQDVVDLIEEAKRRKG